MPDPITQLFDRVVCISLPQRADRRDQLQHALRKAGWPFHMPEIVRAVDGRLARPPACWDRPPGAWGCYRAHLRVLEDALQGGVQSILILEDDALPAPGFAPGFAEAVSAFINNLPGDWDGLMLGGAHRITPSTINDHVVRVRRAHRTHAYALRGQAIARAYRHLSNYVMLAGRLASNEVDWLLADLHPSLRIYAPTRWLIGQAAGRSDIDQTQEQERFWQPPPPEPPEIGDFDYAGNSVAEKTEHSIHPFVAVIGLHRSGSSCTAGVLHKLGVHMGDVLVGSEAPGGGGYEAMGLARLCERAYPFPSTQLAVPYHQLQLDLAGHIHHVQRSARAAGKIAGGKYPHLCAMGNELQEICGAGLRVVHIDRPIEQSIASLKTRVRRERPHAPPELEDRLEEVQRWLWKQKLALLATVPHITLQYRDLLENPAAEIQRLVAYLGLDPTPQQIADAVTHVDPAQCRHSPQPVEVENP